MPRVHTPEGLLDPTVELTMSQAAHLCLVSMEMVNRRRRNGLMPHAHRLDDDGHGRWMVSIADLADAGLLDYDQLADPEAVAAYTAAAADELELQRLRTENDGLRATLAATQAAVAAQQVTIGVHERDIEFLRSLLADADADSDAGSRVA